MIITVKIAFPRWIIVLLLLLATPLARAAFDHRHAAWDALLNQHVVLINNGHASQVNYAGFQADRAALNRYLDSLLAVGEADYRLLIPPQEIPMLITDCDRMLLERLNLHRHLRARMESLLAVVEDAVGDCAKADVAEQRVIDELRQMGNEALTAWAERGMQEQVVLAQAEPAWRPCGKKLYW